MERELSNIIFLEGFVMNEETRYLLSLDVDMNNALERGIFYSLIPRLALDVALIGKIFSSNWRHGWKIIGGTCAMSDIYLCGGVLYANLPKLMKK